MYLVYILGTITIYLDIPPTSNSNNNYKHNKTIVINHIITLLMYFYIFLHLFNILSSIYK